MAERFKLTLTEALALLGVVEREIGLAPVILAIQQAVPAKAGAIIGRERGVRLTADEALALVAALLPLIPAADTRGKMLWLIKNARPCFADPARFHAALDYLKARVEAFVRGGGVDAVPSSALPALGAAPIGGYGRVNQWWKRPDLLDRETSLMLQHGVRCYTIELVGNGEDDVLGSKLKTEEVKAAYIELIRNCRAKGLYLLLGFLNGNMGNGRYRNGKVKLAARLPQARAMMQFVYEQGPANVIFQPIGETQSDADRQIEREAAAMMRGFILVSNGSMGRPSAPASWAQYRAWHPTSTGNWPTGHIAKTILVSDTGAILAQLHKGGDIYGEGNPDAIRAWVRAGAAKGFPIVAHYAFQVEGIDESAIKACGLPVAGAIQPTPPQDTSDDVDLSSAVWHGPNGSKAKVTARMDGLAFNGTNFTYKQSGTSGWKFWNDGGKKLNSYACFFVFRDGKWRGGKFDACSPDRNWRDVKNIYGKYTGGIVPVPGEIVRVCLCGNNFTERTNAPATTWRAK
jgi:hypothetical protein